jgi:hypothetical protein
MHSSVREANLRALLSDDSEVRSHVSELVEVYESILAEDVRGTRLAHMIDVVHPTQQTTDIAYDGKRLRESSLPDAILPVFAHFLSCKYQAFEPVDATEVSLKTQFLDKFSLQGVQYSTATCRARDSHIFFRPSQMSKLQACPEPGQITHIFVHSHAPDHRSPLASRGQIHHPSVYLCVRPYAALRPNLELNKVDQMYRQFGFAGGFLCRKEFASLVIIEPSSIISHIAVTPLHIYGHDLLHILPMDRVSSSLDRQNKRAHGERFSTTSSCRHPSCTPKMLK